MAISLRDKEQENVKDIIKFAKMLEIPSVEITYEGNCAQLEVPTHLIQICNDKAQEQVLAASSYNSLLNADQMEFI